MSLKLFRVVFDVDMEFDKQTKSTPVRREERYYAAARAEDVWEAIALDRADEVMNLIALIEHAPSVAVIPRKTE